jgi:hypothetical protein
MSKKLSIALSVLLFLVVSVAIYAGSCEKDSDCKGTKECINGECQNPPTSFSDNLGAMNWNEAKEKCSSRGMRLPSVEELKVAHESGVTKSWSCGGSCIAFWSSQPEGANKAYVFSIYLSMVDSLYQANNAPHVRCVK